MQFCKVLLRALVPVVMAITFLGCSAAPVETGRTVSANYYMTEISSSSSILDTVYVYDTFTTDLSGNEIMRVYLPGHPIDNWTPRIVTGNGPAGTGDYEMRVIEPDPLHLATNDYFYVDSL